jgi:hypothetical protein
LSLVEASEKVPSLENGREIRGPFTEWFTVHPWEGPYRALLKCGDSVKLLKEFEYREFTAKPYDLGKIAL